MSSNSRLPVNQEAPPDRGHLLTEQRLSASADLDALSIDRTLELINQQDATVAAVARAAIGSIRPVVEKVVAALRRGGRLIYIGAGTSGRLGVLDASECPPTFCTDPHQVVGMIAGGDTALRRSSEGKEDDPDGAQRELDRLEVGALDVVVGIAAGSTTPYVLGAIRIAADRGAVTALISCAAGKSSPADHLIELPVGPEVVTGSTRMKAGTATKLVLNMISTAVMVQLGKTWGNLMVDMKATNDKLRDRAVRILSTQCDLSRPQALEWLKQADNRVKIALIMAKLAVDTAAAERLLVQNDQKLRPILGAPRDVT